MLINPKFQNLSGSFNTETDLLTCHASPKYHRVELCFDGKCIVTFAEIKLFSAGFSSPASVYADAKTLGNEIVNRWNHHAPRSIEQIRDDFEEWYFNEYKNTQHQVNILEIKEARNGDKYFECYGEIQKSWKSWKASRNQALNKKSSLHG